MHCGLGRFIWRLAWGTIRGHRYGSVVKWGQDRGKKKKWESSWKSRRVWKEGWSNARNTFQILGFAVLLFSCLQARGLCCDAVCKKLLAASPELVHAFTAVFSALQGGWKLPGVPLLGTAKYQHHLRQRGHSSAANKASQTAELAEKLGAVTWDRCSSGHAYIHLQSLRTPGFHHPFLPREVWRLPLEPKPCDS